MSEQEKSGPDVAAKAPVLMVEQEQAMDSKHKPFRPTELQDEQPELHNKRSTAPAVPSVAAQMTIKPDDSVQEDNSKSEWKEKEHESTEKLKHKPLLSKKSRSQASKQASKQEPQQVETSLPETETIALTAVGVKDKPIPAAIPTEVKPIPSTVSEPIKPVSKQDDDIITELRTPKSTRKISEWSDDDEEAGGLPRSESRASRVSRAVRQLFCCGTAYSPASEDNISTQRQSSGI